MSTESITITRAREIILETAPEPNLSNVVSLDSACGCITAAAVYAANPLPTYTNSAMDGYAFRYDDLAGTQRAVLPIVGHSFAGAPCTVTDFAPGSCIEIATGAAVPGALDTVIPFEKCEINLKEHSIAFDVCDIKRAANIRYAGEQIQPGDILIEQGTRLTTRHIALMAAAGVTQISTFSPIRVAVITTGSELVEPGEPLGSYQTYNSNAIMLKLMLQAVGCQVQTSAATEDNDQAIAKKITEALKDNDLLLLTGGAGNGRFDLSQTQLGSMGLMQPWSINMRPGRPMRFGQIQGKPVFVLPGNPVAAFVTCLEFVCPALHKMQGLSAPFGLPKHPAVLACDIRKKAGRAEFMRGRIIGYENAIPVVEPLSNQGSADLIMLSQADVILCLDHAPDHYSKGEIVSVQSLHQI